ncbi:alkaline phosphatase [Croceibacterium mercuriale]|uniref:Alkaline phosphatase n=1 Tax=Croceibacterium mercuriale TaxID=1572751 RepID=A0A0B2C1Q0_9SPHN|nr:DedA family protein [Croceibacterium mercuriale]KHL25921.1 alkaline phosphatase [Croceibacterium mercuriale]
MDQWIIEIVDRGGYIGIALLMALENIIPPIPSELIMGLGGILVARGAMDFWPLLVVGTLGTTVGNYVWFWIGHRFGYNRLEPVVSRWGRWLTLEWEDIEHASRFFRRHGHWVVFCLRFSPVLRTMISLPAGLMQMPVGKFLIFTFAGSAVWNAILILGGRYLAPIIEQYEGAMTWVIVGSVALGVAIYLYRVLTWKPRAERD